MTDSRLAHCKTCEAPIIWLRTTAGSSMPTDAETVGLEDTVFDLKKKHISHFATCPEASFHRKPCKPRSK
jgi:hypothetical protein